MSSGPAALQRAPESLQQRQRSGRVCLGGLLGAEHPWHASPSGRFAAAALPGRSSPSSRAPEFFYFFVFLCLSNVRVCVSQFVYVYLIVRCLSVAQFVLDLLSTPSLEDSPIFFHLFDYCRLLIFNFLVSPEISL